jgi:hypothetical protein
MRDIQTKCSSEANQLRAEIIAEMQGDGLIKEVFDDIQISLREPKEAVDVLDIDSVPEEFIRIKKEPDKVAILKAAKSGLAANWFTIKREPTLQIKGIINTSEG